MTGTDTHKPAPLWPSAALTAVFGVLALLGLLHHEMWRDELHVWLLCAESGSITDLFRNMATEWHPALWYLLTWLVTKVTQHAEGMQFVSLAFGLGSVWLVARRSPFSWPVKVLLCTGYHFLFEYTLIARVYSAELFLLLLSVHFLTMPGQRKTEWKAGLSLLALSLTVIHGTIIASGLVLYMLLRHRRWISISLASAGVLAAVCHVAYQAIAAGYLDDRYYASQTHDLAWLTRVFTSFLNGMMPLPDWREAHFWNTHLLRPSAVGPAFWTGVILSVACLALVCIWLWRNKPLLLSWILAVLGIYFLIGFLYEGFTRHHGQFFLATLAVLWIKGRESPSRRWREAALAGMLGVGWIGGAFAYLQDWQRPFTNARPAAEFLMATPLQDAQWASSLDFCATPVAYHGGRKIFSAQSAGPVSWIWWAENDWDRKVTQPQAIQRFDSLATATGKPVAAILSLPANLKLDAGNHMHLFPGAKGSQLDRVFFLLAVEGAIVEDENYLLYAIGDFEGNTRPSLLSQLVGRRGLHDLPDTTGSVKHHFDQLVVNDTAVVFSGWSILSEQGDSLARPSVVLRGEKFGYVMPAVRHYRKDVRDAFPEECDTDSAGFHLVVPRSWIAPGKYSVGAYLINDKLQQGLVVRDSLEL